ncbi:MAG: hypothetical protein NVS9B10_13490 [Nevskia sp.]
MALSSNSKRGLAITALLPVLLSVYSEYRKDAETQGQRQAARIELLRQRHEAEQGRDLENAKKLLTWITGDVADPADTLRDGSFCDHLFVASELVRATRYSTATRQALGSALEYRRETGGSEGGASLPLVCECGNTLSLMRTSWAPTRHTAASLPVVAEMTDLLARTAALCAPDPQLVSRVAVSALAPAAGAAPPPPKTKTMMKAKPRGPGAVANPAPPPPREAPSPDLPADVCAKPAPGAALSGPGAQAATVYIQIAVEAQRPAAQRLLQRLQAAGYVAPGIERVGAARAPARDELRYIYSEDGPSAARLLADVHGACGDEALFGSAPQLLARLRGQALPRSFDLWFGKPPSPSPGAAAGAIP